MRRLLMGVCFAALTLNCEGAPADRSHVATEGRHPETGQMHRMAPKAVLSLLVKTSDAAPQAVKEAVPQLGEFLEDLIPRYQRGGRLIMLGAGTSGRLAVIEAAEMLPTFKIEPGRVVGLIAGGLRCMVASSEALEDASKGVYHELEQLQLTPDDTLIGITAGGSTPFVHGAIAFAKERGCMTALLSCAQTEGADHVMILPTGPEPLTGSTRMNAGTATKIALNSITTALMVAEGRVYENLMICVNASNEKLRDRAARIITQVCGCSREEAFSRLEEAGGSVKKAIESDLEESEVVAEGQSAFREFLQQGFERIVCIDGGGSKTLVQVVDAQGKSLGGFRRGGPLNINSVGIEQVRATLTHLLEGIEPEGAALVAGVAGAESEENLVALQEAFSQMGFNHHWVRGDSQLLADGLAPKGVVLIAGTGSNCEGVLGDRRVRCGGLGSVLGDEGSGYFIGREAIRAALAERQGWGEPTGLTALVEQCFGVERVEELIAPINSGLIGKAKVAALAREVLALEDRVAKRIVAQAAEELADMVRKTGRMLGVARPDVVLIGGLFRSESFCAQFEARAPMRAINLSQENPAAWAVRAAI